jgi:hypothetical protein
MLDEYGEAVSNKFPVEILFHYHLIHLKSRMLLNSALRGEKQVG